MPLDSSITKVSPQKKSIPDNSLKISNQLVIDEYNNFVNTNVNGTFPNKNLLPNTEVFDQINQIYPTIIRNSANEIEEDRQNALYTLFNTPQQVGQYFQDPSSSLNITLPNNNDYNLYTFLTKVLYFQKREIFKTGKIDISQVKHQLGKDLHRAGNITINGVLVPNEELLAFADKDQAYEEVDYFNLRLMESINTQNTPISLNTINLTDLCCIQQSIQFVSDMIVYPLASAGVMQRGGEKKINIIINSNEQYIESYIDSLLVALDYNDPMALPSEWGNFIGKLNFNLKNLTYSFQIDINKNPISTPADQGQGTQEANIESSLGNQNLQKPGSSTLQSYASNISNIGQGAIDYVKNNPDTVAKGVGTAAVLGSSVGMLFLAGILGGKSKKHLRNKNNNKQNKYRKTIRKNKKHKTRKSISKNKKQHKTKKYNN
jgi:hypothetical protein